MASAGVKEQDQDDFDVMFGMMLYFLCQFSLEGTEHQKEQAGIALEALAELWPEETEAWQNR